ncbi:MAG: hypothetical protein M8865_11255 [marine benthic group bacterium]|nr:hypothetical protein [Gemmatimonadota bacterium]
MLAREGRKSRIMAVVLALAVPAFAITACNDDPLFDLPPDPPTNVATVVNGQDVTVNWTPGINATSQEVRLSPVVAVPASAGNALQAEDYVAVYNDNTTNTHTFTNVEPGPYTVTVTAINASSRAPSEIATVTVAGGNAAPTITSFGAVEGTPTTLRIEWTDVEGEENYRVTATPDDDSPEFIDIASSNATFFEFSGAVVGATYTAQVCAIFAGDVEECSATTTYTVAGNQAPTAEITAPADLAEFFDTELITFTGTGTDAEDGALTGESLAWSSDLDGPLGTGEELADVDASTVSLGEHVITLTATDSEGATGVDSITITIRVPSFATDVQPWFVDTGCTGCHVAGGIAESIPLDTYDAIVNGVNGNDDPLIVSGDSSLGVLIPLLGTDHAGGPYDAFATDTLSVWVDDGALDN